MPADHPHEMLIVATEYLAFVLAQKVARYLVENLSEANVDTVLETAAMCEHSVLVAICQKWKEDKNGTLFKKIGKIFS